jgi:hypothetical protein
MFDCSSAGECLAMSDVVMAADVAPREPATELGPAMRALPIKWQRAVVALFACKGNMTAAFRAAGYKHGPKAEKANAWRLFHDDRVRAAVREVAVRSIDLAEPEVLGTVLQIMRDTDQKAQDRLAAARMLWDRSNPVLNKTKIEIEAHLSVDELDVSHYRALKQIGAPHQAFLDRFGFNGLPRVEALVAAADAKDKVIDGTAEEINGEG